MVKAVLDHIHLRSQNPTEAAQFYIDIFGAEMVQNTPGSSRIRISIGGTRIFIDPALPSDSKPTSLVVGIDHFGLLVESMDAAIAQLKAGGAEILTPPSSPLPGVKLAFVRGPDDIRIELLERAPAPT